MRRAQYLASLMVVLRLSTAYGQNQAFQPWGVTGAQLVVAGSPVTTVLGRSGNVFLAGSADEFAWPPATKSFGDTSQWVNYVSRISGTGQTIFTTALGGAFQAGIKVDSSGNIFVTGAAASTGFYTTPGAYRSSPPTDYSSFACKLRGSDGDLLYCTYLDFGGNPGSAGSDANGNLIMVSGPVAAGVATPGALNTGENSIYVAELDATGSRLIYGATFGGSVIDYPDYATVDAAGNVYITGRTYSTDFPTTPNAVVRNFVPTPANLESSFLAKVSADGKSLVYSTLGVLGEQPMALSLDSSGEAQVLYLDANGGIGIRRYNSDASAIVFDTRLNVVDTPSDGPLIMALDAAADTTVLGLTGSIDLPTLHPSQTCRFASMPAGFENGYMVRLGADGELQQFTYLQGSGSPQFADMAVSAGSSTIALWSVNEAADGTITGQLELATVAPAPGVRLACFGSAASLSGGAFAPGEIISLFGQQLGPTEPAVGDADAHGRYPLSLGNATVTFDGTAAPLLYASDGQINAVVPFEVKSFSQMCVRLSQASNDCIDVPTVRASPAIFTWPVTPGSGDHYALAINQGGALNSKQNPAPIGSMLTLFGTGLGTVSPASADGTIAGQTPETQDLTVEVLSANLDIDNPLPVVTKAEWAGQAPLEIAGLSQVNVQVPQYGNRITLRLSQSGSPYWYSNGVLIWVKAP